MSDDEIPRIFDKQMREDLRRHRVLVLDGQLDDDNGTALTTQVLMLAAQDPTKDIALWIHSPGGSVPSMLAIRDVMKLVPCDVRSEERRVGKECRSRWSPDHEKTKDEVGDGGRSVL